MLASRYVGGLVARNPLRELACPRADLLQRHLRQRRHDELVGLPSELDAIAGLPAGSDGELEQADREKVVHAAPAFGPPLWQWGIGLRLGHGHPSRSSITSGRPLRKPLQRT